MKTETIIEVDRLQRSDHRQRKPLLVDVSLRVAPGDRLAILGPSGSGKTLLLRSLALLDPWDDGQLLWHGEAIHGAAVPGYRRKVMYLRQKPAFAEGTVEHNLKLPFSLAVHQNRRYDRQRVVGLLERLQRDDSFLDQQQSDLSGGEAQIVMVLRALILEPTVLLLDEPTAALDSAAQSAVEMLIDGWFDERPEERAFLWVTHNRQQAQRVASSILNMAGGRLTGPR